MGFMSPRLTTLLVVSVLCILAAAEEEGEEVASPIAVAIAATLLGTVSIVLVLYYLLNWPDPDMRRYSYEVLCSTISIFCAVLMFQSIQQVVEAYLLEGTSVPFQILVNFVHRLVWHVILQVSIAWMSYNIFSNQEARQKILNDHHLLRDVDINVRCFCVLLAHICGFASINLWGSVQQTEFFRQSPLMSWLVVPLAVLFNLPLMKITGAVRNRIATADGIRDQLEVKWEEEVVEAENDVASLALSFLTVQSLKFWICGSLANSEGEESAEVALAHSSHQVLALFGYGLACIVLFSIFVVLDHWKEEAKEEKEKKEKSHHKSESHTTEHKASEKSEGHAEGHHAEEEEDEEEGSRYLEVAFSAFAMGMAWCFFYATKWLLGVAYLGWEDFGGTTLLTLVLAVVLTGVCFSFIFVLDKIADLDSTGKLTDKIIITIVGAIAILVGFSWEQNFDAAVGALASRTENPVIVKLCLGFFCAALIVPAWKLYMLPMVVHQGWRYGFLAHSAMKHFDPNDEDGVVYYFEILKHLASFGDHAVKPPSKERNEDSTEGSGSKTEPLLRKMGGGPDHKPRLLAKADDEKVKELRRKVREVLKEVQATFEEK